MKSLRHLAQRLSFTLLTLVCIGCENVRVSTKANSAGGWHKSASSWQSLAEKAELPLKPEKASEVDNCMQRLALRLRREPAHPSNYGDRTSTTSAGRKMPNSPSLIVLHETVISAADTIELFQRNHPSDDDQVSYHKLIERDGTQTTLVEDSKRAYGAGMSHYGGYTLRSQAASPGSINNIALHASLESPQQNNSETSGAGYTTQQYQSLAATILAWQMRYGIPMVNVTTHEAVDRSHSRYDPRNFKWDLFDRYHREYAKMCNAERFSFRDV